MKKILLFVPGYLPGFKSGGPVRTVSNMVEALGDIFSFHIMCMDRDLGDQKPYSAVSHETWNKQGKGMVFYLAPGLPGLLKLISTLQNNEFEIININSFFSFKFSIIPLVFCKIFRLKKTIIIGPRGEFSKGALALKSTKKNSYIKLVKALGLYRNIIWHASSPHERDEIRRVMGPNANIRIAIDIAKPEENIYIPERFPGAPLRLIFISRISPMKNLIGALRLLSSVRNTVTFDVFGPIEDNQYWEQCLAMASILPENIKFSYKGTLSPVNVTSKFAEYDLFLFPTLGENFGHVIAEALFAGLPVLISNSTPWRNLEEKGLGWDISLGQPELFIKMIEECCKIPSEEYRAWRSKIQAWALNNIGNHEAIEENRQLFMIE